MSGTQVTIKMNKYLQKALLAWLEDDADPEFSLLLHGFPLVIFKKEGVTKEEKGEKE